MDPNQRRNQYKKKKKVQQNFCSVKQTLHSILILQCQYLCMTLTKKGIRVCSSVGLIHGASEVVHQSHFILIVLQLLLTFPFSDLMTHSWAVCSATITEATVWTGKVAGCFFHCNEKCAVVILRLNATIFTIEKSQFVDLPATVWLAKLTESFQKHAVDLILWTFV